MIARRLRAELPLKLTLSLTLTLYFCIPYFTLQRVTFFQVRTLPLTDLDRAIGFAPSWIWTYQSVYLLMALVPWFADRADALRRYARGFILLSSIGFVCFVLVPIPAPRPADVPTTGMFGLLLMYDGTLNSFPSLHCGLAAYTVLLAADLSRERLRSHTRRWLLGLLTLWCLAICYATLATKQHYAVDLPPGILLGWLCHRWAWRNAEMAEGIAPRLPWSAARARRT